MKDLLVRVGTVGPGTKTLFNPDPKLARTNEYERLF
jgi:hypothetical protein